MDSVWTVIGAFCLLTLVVEAVLWKLFSARASTLLLARELDASSFGLWTMGRIRFFAVVHMLFMLATITAFLLWVW